MAITGVPVGGKGSFKVTWNGAIGSGAMTTWSADVPTLTLTPDTSDGQNVVVISSGGETAPSFQLTAMVVNSVGASITAVATVPLIPAPPTPATSGTIDQTA